MAHNVTHNMCGERSFFTFTVCRCVLWFLEMCCVLTSSVVNNQFDTMYSWQKVRHNYCDPSFVANTQISMHFWCWGGGVGIPLTLHTWAQTHNTTIQTYYKFKQWRLLCCAHACVAAAPTPDQIHFICRPKVFNWIENDIQWRWRNTQS